MRQAQSADRWDGSWGRHLQRLRRSPARYVAASRTYPHPAPAGTPARPFQTDRQKQDMEDGV